MLPQFTAIHTISLLAIPAAFIPCRTAVLISVLPLLVQSAYSTNSTSVGTSVVVVVDVVVVKEVVVLVMVVVVDEMVVVVTVWLVVVLVSVVVDKVVVVVDVDVHANPHIISQF